MDLQTNNSMTAPLLSRASAYAIRAMAYLAAQPAGRLCGAAEISEREEIPQPFLWKILHSLRQHRLLQAVRGSKGGYSLVLPPGQIKLIRIIEALEGVPEADQCMLGRDRCSGLEPCALHYRLEPVRRHFFQILENTTLEEILPAGCGHGARVVLAPGG